MRKKLKYMCFLKNKYYFKKSVCFIFIYSIFAHCFHIILKPTSINLAFIDTYTHAYHSLLY